VIATGDIHVTRPWKIAIVGFGKIACEQHRPAIADSPDFQLAAIISSSAHAVDVPVFRTLEDAFASGLALDAVALCTPPQVRQEVCDLATARGLAVLLEKPPAATVAQAQALAAMGSSRGVTVFAGWHSRFAPFVEEARTWCAAHDGLHGRIEWHEDHLKWHPGQAWLWQLGGLGVLDPGINSLSILTVIRPGAWHLSGAAFEQPENADTPRAARFSLGRNGDHVDVSFRFAENTSETWSIQLRAENGDVLHLADGGAALSLNGGAFRRKANAEYAGVYRRFAELMRSGQCDVDTAALCLTEEAFRTAEITLVEPVTI